MELSEKKMESSQAFMMNEIEEFCEKNMNEMHKQVEEIKYSLEEEIKGVDGKLRVIFIVNHYLHIYIKFD